MGTSREQRVAENEAFFRDVNEEIRAAAGEQAADGHLYEFLCECADARCVERVRLTIAEYELIRSDARRFLLAPGHDLRDVEQVVAANRERVVVEKVGLAGRIAEDLEAGAGSAG
jgi:hypothetical protein